MTRQAHWTDWVALVTAGAIFVLSFVPAFMGNLGEGFSVYQIATTLSGNFLGRAVVQSSILLWIFPVGGFIAFFASLAAVGFAEARSVVRWLNCGIGAVMLVALAGFFIETVNVVTQFAGSRSTDTGDITPFVALFTFNFAFWLIFLGAFYLFVQVFISRGAFNNSALPTLPPRPAFAPQGFGSQPSGWGTTAQSVDRSPQSNANAHDRFRRPAGWGTTAQSVDRSPQSSANAQQGAWQPAAPRRAVQTRPSARRSGASSIHRLPAARRPLANAWLIERDQHQESSHQLLEGETRIGRKRDLNDIVIRSERISRQQAIIRQHGQHFYIYEVGSQQQIYVNNQAVRGNTEIRHNDVIRFGQQDPREFIFVKPNKA